MVAVNVKRGIFFLYQKFMGITGTWPLDRRKYGSTIAFWSTTLLHLVAMMIALINRLEECSTFTFHCYDLRLFVWGFFELAKKIIFRLSSDQMIPLIESTMEDWSSITDPEEREIMMRHDKYGCFIFAIQLSIMAANVISRTPSIWSSNDNSTWMTFSRILGLIVFTMNSFMIFNMKVLFWSLTMHLSSQYKILKERFRDSLLIRNKKESRKFFRRLVDRHNELFDLSERLENSFTVFNTFIVVGSQSLACVFAVLLVGDIKALRFLSGAKNLSVVMNTLAVLSIVYYAGDYLADCSEEVGAVFTQCNWYDLSKEFRNNYSMVIMRCRRPTRLTIIKIYKLNLFNFKYVLQALYSYVSLLVAITKDMT